jgi:uncharacterized protein
MRHQLLNDDQRTFAVVLQTGEQAMACLQKFVCTNEISAAQLSIGAFAEATLGYLDWNKKDYASNPVQEQAEVASMVADVAFSPLGEPTLHINVVAGKRDGTAFAGHVRPTLEVIFNSAPFHPKKVHDPQSGLALIRPK